MKKVLPLLLVLFYMSTFAQQQAAFTGTYPATKKVNQTDDFFGTTVADPYRWLENDTAADTKAWVQEQNTVTQAYLNKIPFRDKIKNRLTQLWNYERFSAPFTEGAFTYFYKNNGLQNQAVLYRQTEAGTPEVFLDPNTFSTDGTIALSGIEFTHDGSLAAYTISIGGSDWNKLMVINRDLRRVARRVHAVLARDRLECGELLERRLAEPLVAVDQMGRRQRLTLLVEIGRLDRDVLVVEAALGPRSSGTLL